MKSKIMMLIGFLLFFLILGGITVASFEEDGRGDKGKQVVITFLQTKNDADCAVITQGDTAIMIDTGEAEDADTILTYLKENKITKLQYLILSHPDADHVGGAEAILKEVPAERIIRPYYEGDKTTWNQFETVIPTHTRKIKLADMEILLYPPLEKHYQDSNNYSMAVLIRHGEVTALFPGDAIKKRTEELLQTDWPEITIYKAAHHGRQNRYSEEFLKEIKPDYMVVTSNHADELVKKTCEEQGGEIFYTGTGNKQFISNGITVEYQK